VTGFPEELNDITFADAVGRVALRVPIGYIAWVVDGVPKYPFDAGEQ
jgi:hypothetical protein